MKSNRQRQIIKLLDKNSFLKVSDASKTLGVAAMTIRRDLLELEEKGEVERVHGGARKKVTTNQDYTELTHTQKSSLNIEEKRYVAKQAAELIQENDVVFIGAGTTTEHIHEFIKVKAAKIVTNSISIFQRFKDDSRYELILIGGQLREQTGTFVGYFTRKWIQDIKVQKVFLGTNGIKNQLVTTAEEEELIVQEIILANSDESYILADSSKFGVQAFQVLCETDMITAIITDSKLPIQFKKYYQDKCRVIN